MSCHLSTHRTGCDDVLLKHNDSPTSAVEESMLCSFWPTLTMITKLPLKRARSSIGADRGSGLTRPLLTFTWLLVPFWTRHLLHIPHGCYPPPPINLARLTCYPLTWMGCCPLWVVTPPAVHGDGVSEVPWPLWALIFVLFQVLDVICTFDISMFSPNHKDSQLPLICCWNHSPHLELNDLDGKWGI